MSKKHFGRESRGDLEPGRVPGSTKPTTNFIYGTIPDFPILTYGANHRKNGFRKFPKKNLIFPGAMKSWSFDVLLFFCLAAHQMLKVERLS